MIFFFLWTLTLPVTGTGLAQFYAPVGGTIYLFSESNVTPEHWITWYSATNTKIAQLAPGSDPTYMGRCSAARCQLFYNGTLRMDQLTAADNTTFSVSTELGDTILTVKVQLSVYNLLTAPTIIASSSIRPVNGTNLYLSCNAGIQTVHNVYFFHNEELVTCDESHLSCNSSSTFLYFSPILDTDSGNYSCVIRNPVSYNRSMFHTLNIAVNVSKVTLTNNATRPINVDKDSVALRCSSYGTDLSYTWTLMGSPLLQDPRYHFADDNATLVISPVMRNDQGEFTCVVSNYLNSGISNPLNLTWSPDGQITCDAQRLHQNITLYCSWPGGYPPAQVHMTYPDMSLTEIDRVITEVPSHQFTHGTPLSCTGTQLGYSQTCSLVIDVPHSPGFINDSITAGGEGMNAFLYVSLSYRRAGQQLIAEIFPAKFSWYKLEPNPVELFTGGNISIISNSYSSFLFVHHITQEMVGRYMCSAVNPIGSNSFTFILNMMQVEQASSNDILSAGAIAGIVIGSAAVLALVALTFVLFLRKKPKAQEIATDSVVRNRPLVSNCYENRVVDQVNPENEQDDIYSTVINQDI